MKFKNNRMIFLTVYLAYVSIYVARVNLSMAGLTLFRLMCLIQFSLAYLAVFFLQYIQ